VAVCAACNLPLGWPRIMRRIGAKDLCNACADMHEAINENKYMQEAQSQYEAEVKRITKLKPGSNYLE
jgi:hypothetical protein